MLGKLAFELLPIIRRCRLATELKFASTQLTGDVKREYGTSSSLHVETSSALPVDEELREIFRFKDTKISNWIVEVTARAIS